MPQRCRTERTHHLKRLTTAIVVVAPTSANTTVPTSARLIFIFISTLLLGLTLVLVGVACFSAYRPAANESCSADGGACTPASRRTAKIIVWIAAALAVLLITFPYYIGYLM